ncbi:MAG: hypothetical protein AB7P20_09255 [Rhizobiaceae bacterium]
MDHDDLVSRLQVTYQERQFAYGVVGSVAIMEVYVSEAGTWTIIMTDIAGRSCIIAAGEGWEHNTPASTPAL